MNKNILVIGGTGFIGSNLLKKLNPIKYNLNSISSKLPLKEKKIKGVNYIRLDISKKKDFIKLKKLNFDVAINLGGYVDHSKIKKTFKSHFGGTKNLVNYFNKKKLKLFIQIGSSLEYGNVSSPQKESSKCKPRGNYGLAKYKASKYLVNFRNLKFRYLILRLYQVYGPHQDTSRLIPQVITSCIDKKKFSCTDGKQLRDFLYIEDFINLILKILKSKKIENNVYNVGCGKPVTIKLIIQKIHQKIKKGKPLFGNIKMRKDEILKLYPSINKIKKKFKWSPKTNIDKGLNKTIQFYRNN
ncbi:NAD-dependent epimerase/dehydratase [Candidatus Pelagibacter bacterium]|nr:NAD-dependent epimerase/dehydratase [Candidatus Pelagibacter bacterium]